MGFQNKLLAKLDSKSLIQHALEAIAASSITNCHIVTGFEHTQVENEINSVCRKLVLPCTHSRNEHYTNGMATTIVQGISKLTSCDAVIICLADMPSVTPVVFDKLIAAYHANPYKSIFVSCYKQRRGNPVLITSRIFNEVLALTGDTGVKQIMVNNPELVLDVESDCEGVLHDIDTPGDIESYY